MENIHKTVNRFRVIGFLIVTTSFLIAGCSGYRDMPLRKLADGKIVFISAKTSRLEINNFKFPEANGTVFFSDGYTVSKIDGFKITSGKLSAEDLSELRQALEKIDFETIRSRKFEGECHII